MKKALSLQHENSNHRSRRSGLFLRKRSEKAPSGVADRRIRKRTEALAEGGYHRRWTLQSDQQFCRSEEHEPGLSKRIQSDEAPVQALRPSGYHAVVRGRRCATGDAGRPMRLPTEPGCHGDCHNAAQRNAGCANLHQPACEGNQSLQRTQLPDKHRQPKRSL